MQGFNNMTVKPELIYTWKTVAQLDCVTFPLGNKYFCLSLTVRGNLCVDFLQED